ncbi:MAG: S4 domain-containing protein [Akkermansiaceae bacterium]|jgi:ribosome-associated heat shock protein Hsp15|nr:S4 domain-containing protein [Akkermansiaceae bacterium]
MGLSDRTDKWLWAVRLCKTRGVAAELCAAGKVTRRGHRLKPATPLHPGDLVELPFPDGPGHRTVAVVTVIQQRVGAPQARLCYEDHTSADALEAQRAWQAARHDSPRGRPTKKDRRSLDRIRGFFQ